MTLKASWGQLFRSRWTERTGRAVRGRASCGAEVLALINPDESRRAIRVHTDGMPVKLLLWLVTGQNDYRHAEMLVLEYLGLMRWDRQPGKALQTQWNLAKVEQRVAVWTAGCKTEEKRFVRHPNILFGQLAVLGWRPRFPFVEFRERVAVWAAFWTHTSLEIRNLKWYNYVLHCSVPLKRNDIQIHSLLKLKTEKNWKHSWGIW